MRVQREFEHAVDLLGGTVFTVIYQVKSEYHPIHLSDSADLSVVGLESCDAETGDLIELSDFLKLQTTLNEEFDLAAINHATEEWERGE